MGRKLADNLVGIKRADNIRPYEMPIDYYKSNGYIAQNRVDIFCSYPCRKFQKYVLQKCKQLFD